MAFGAKVAAALSGASLSQLSYRRGPSGRQGGRPVLVPEVSRRPVLYSFRDVVALRMCVFLREERSLQKIRRAITKLRDLGGQDHLSTYKLVATDRGSIALVDDVGAVDLVKYPGQEIIAEMRDILAPFFNQKRGVVVPEFFHPRRSLLVDEGIRGGHPVVAGTRVPYELVADLVADGVPPGHVSDYYPMVSAEAATDAADFADYVERVGRAS